MIADAQQHRQQFAASATTSTPSSDNDDETKRRSRIASDIASEHPNWDPERRRRSSGERRRAADNADADDHASTKLYGLKEANGRLHLKKVDAQLDADKLRQQGLSKEDPDVLDYATARSITGEEDYEGPDAHGLTLAARRELVLGAMPLIASMPFATQMKIVAAFQARSFKKGQTIFRNGQYTDTIYVVQSGEYGAFSKAVDMGDRPVASYRTGMIMCERALYESAKQPKLTITCLRDGGLYSLSGVAYRAICDGAITAFAMEMGDLPFLGQLPCCKHLGAKALQQLSDASRLFVTENSEEVSAVFTEAASAGSVVVIKAGSITCQMPRPKEATAGANERYITLKPGDMLGPVGLAWFAELQSKGMGKKNPKKKKGVSWAPLPTEEDYFDGPENERTALRMQQRSTAHTKGVALLIFNGEELGRIAPEARNEARRCIVRKVLHAMEAFQGFNNAELDRLVQSSRLVDVPSATLVSQQGASRASFGAPDGGYMYVILDGSARVWRKKKLDNDSFRAKMAMTPRSGDDERSSEVLARPDELELARARKGETLGHVGCGDHFLAIAILDPDAVRGASVTTTADTKCLLFNREAFGELFEQVKHSLARELSNRRWIMENRNKVTMEDLTIGSCIGEGTFGRVKIVFHTARHVSYALKVQRKEMLVQCDQVEHVNSEVTLLATCNHPFILRVLAAYQDTTHCYMILEIVLGGELFMLHQQEGKFTLDTTRFYAANVIAAFAYLNSLGIVFRDLKLENLLIDHMGYLKVVDFGFAKVLKDSKLAFTFCGTPDYMAPEFIMWKPHSFPVDWWSTGVFIYEMMVGRTPFTSDDQPSTFKKIVRYANGEAGLSFPWFFPGVASDLIRSFLHVDPSQRPSMETAKTHDFFTSVDFMALEKKRVEPPHIPLIEGHTDTRNFAEVESDSEDEGDMGASEHKRESVTQLDTSGTKFSRRRSSYTPDPEYVNHHWERFPTFTVIADDR